MTNSVETKLRTDFNDLIPIYKAWGSFVDRTILKRLRKTGRTPEEIIKIPQKPRIKPEDSFIGKALYRGKSYTNPIHEIEDIVGLRYVVLLYSDIKAIENIIVSENIWERSKDKDFTKQIQIKPKEFGYQAVHYVVKNKQPIIIKNIKIPEMTPCEIQIKTMLQHTWSEIDHDTIYKPRSAASSEITRLVYQTMVLMEITDNIFENVSQKIEGNKMYAQTFALFSKIYNNHIKPTPNTDPKVNQFIFDAYSSMLSKINPVDIEEFFNLPTNQYMFDIISRKYPHFFLYRQPVSLLVYFLLSTQDNNTRKIWPLTEKELEPFLTDLGY